MAKYLRLHSVAGVAGEIIQPDPTKQSVGAAIEGGREGESDRGGSGSRVEAGKGLARPEGDTTGTCENQMPFLIAKNFKGHKGILKMFVGIPFPMKCPASPPHPHHSLKGKWGSFWEKRLSCISEQHFQSLFCSKLFVMSTAKTFQSRSKRGEQVEKGRETQE